MLRAPSVYVMAVWLRNLNEGEDIVLPIDPAAQTQTGAQIIGGAGMPQSSTHFIASIRSAAKQSLAFDSRPESDEGADTGGSGPAPRKKPRNK